MEEKHWRLPARPWRPSAPPIGAPGPARTIVGSYMGSAVLARDIPVYAQLWRGGRLPVEKLVSSVITLNKINEAMDADGNAIRQIVMFN